MVPWNTSTATHTVPIVLTSLLM